MAVSVDRREEQQAMVDRVAEEYDVELDFTLLSDPGHAVIDRYGILNTESDRGIPHPTTYVIDRDGVVRWKMTEVNYRIRPTNEDILRELEKLR